jgi:hypothetical protein
LLEGNFGPEWGLVLGPGPSDIPYEILLIAAYVKHLGKKENEAYELYTKAMEIIRNLAQVHGYQVDELLNTSYPFIDFEELKKFKSFINDCYEISILGC